MRNKRFFEYTDKKSGLTYRRSPLDNNIICYRGEFKNSYGSFRRGETLDNMDEMFGYYSESEFVDFMGTSRVRFSEGLTSYTKEIDSKLFSEEPYTEYTMYIDRTWIDSKLNICAVQEGDAFRFITLNYSSLYKDYKTKNGTKTASFTEIYGKADAQDTFISKKVGRTMMRILVLHEYPSHIEAHVHDMELDTLVLGEATGVFDFEDKLIYF